MTLTTTWKNSGSMGILDSALASMKAAKALAGEWLFMIGNVNRVSKTIAK